VEISWASRLDRAELWTADVALSTWDW